MFDRQLRDQELSTERPKAAPLPQGVHIPVPGSYSNPHSDAVVTGECLRVIRHRLRPAGLVVALLLSVWLCIARPAPVGACSCDAPPQPTLASRIKEAEIISIARVVEQRIDDTGENNSMVGTQTVNYVFETESVLRGELASSFIVVERPSCTDPLPLGVGARIAFIDEPFVATTCGAETLFATDLERALESNPIVESGRIVAIDPAPTLVAPPTTAAPPTPGDDDSSGIRLMSAIAAGSIIVVAAIVVGFRRRSRRQAGYG